MSDLAIEKFGEVAQYAAIQELKSRLLANKTPGIEQSAYEFSVSKTNEKIIEHFQTTKNLTHEEADYLTKSFQIRNKILHGEFDEAVKRIQSLIGQKLPGKPGIMVKLPDDCAGILKAIEDAAGKVKNQNNEMTKDIFGGLLDCLNRGAFDAAIDIFKKSNDVIDRLINLGTPLESK